MFCKSDFDVKASNKYHASVIIVLFAFFAFLLLFNNVNLAGAQEESDTKTSKSVPAIEQIIRVGLMPSLTADSNQEISVDGSRVAMFRLYNKWTGEHFYTSSKSERDLIANAGWVYEQIEWYAPTSEDFKPVYRLYNKYVSGGDHHYTTSAEERDACVKAGWSYEGEGWRTVEEGATDYVKVLRQYNPYATTGTHNYTTDEDEQKYLVSLGWRAEADGGWGGYSKLGPASSDDSDDSDDSGTRKELDFSKFTVDTSDKAYQYGEEIEPIVKAEGLTYGKDYEVVYSDNINAGTGKILVKGIGSYTGSKEYKFTIVKREISMYNTSARLEDDDFTYDGTEKTAIVTRVMQAVYTLSEGDYVVTNNKATTPGTYSLTVTGTGNFYGSTTAKFIINTAELTVTNVKVKDKPYDGWTSATVESGWNLRGVIGDDDVSVTVTARFSYDACKNETNLSVPVTIKYNITGAQWYYYRMSEDSVSEVTAAIFKSFNVKFETNGGSKIDSQWVADGDCAVRPADPTMSGKTFAGWYLDEDLSYSDFSFREPVFEGMTYYAKWIDNKNIAGAWLQEPKAENPVSDAEGAVSATEITNDVNVLRAGVGNATYASTKTKWESYMAGETEKHLYAEWSGDDAGQAANQWVEFRILQVGEHLNDSSDKTSGDGSTVTFMATHSLPTAKQMNADSSVTTAWSGSDMHKLTNEDGGYVMSGLKNLASSVTPIKKMQATYDSGTSTWNDEASLTSGDTFWLISYSELFGEASDWTISTFKVEGSQYDWCKTHIGSLDDPTVAVSAIAGINKTRDGSNPAGLGGTSWWERSPLISSSANNFGNVMASGSQETGYISNFNFGVVPCFAF